MLPQLSDLRRKEIPATRMATSNIRRLLVIPFLLISSNTAE